MGDSVALLRATMEISWTGFVKNEEIFRGVNKERNILRKTKKKKANRIGYIL
jgi:hypothetical protein